MRLPLLAALLVTAQIGGWNLDRHSIPIEDIRGGGPPKDGIPALLEPEFITADEADKILIPEDRVIGVRSGGTVKAYPIRILNYHELVNDEAGGGPILVSW